jgi:S-adenosyl-L-methionine hydrolase (adenosine-forming)
MARPVVALLTDFGTRDHYAGALKGVIVTICPDVMLVDISHDIPPHDVTTGALELAACYRYFPPGTIFVVVIDPGVGSSRRPLGAETGDHRFVAPDNGVLTAVFQEAPPRRVVELTERRYARPTISRTFEGRDRFAPAAGWLARGIELKAFGRTIHDYQMLPIPTPEAHDDGRVSGQVLRVDRFGNLVTNIDRRLFERSVGAQAARIRVGSVVVHRLIGTYAEAGEDQVCALFGGTDHLEIAVNGGSAAERLGAGRGAAVEVVPLPPGDEAGRVKT